MYRATKGGGIKMPQVIIQIKGLEQTNERIAGIAAGLKTGMGPAFQEIGVAGSKYFGGIAFDNRGSVFGASWPTLADSTVADKLKHWRGKPIMVRTGRMMNGFTYEADGVGVRLYNEAPYFKYHQSSEPRTKLPRRIMLGINDSFRTMVAALIKTQVGVIIDAGGR